MVLVDYTGIFFTFTKIFVHPYINTTVYSYGLLIFLTYFLLVNVKILINLIKGRHIHTALVF